MQPIIWTAGCYICISNEEWQDRCFKKAEAGAFAVQSKLRGNIIQMYIGQQKRRGGKNRCYLSVIALAWIKQTLPHPCTVPMGYNAVKRRRIQGIKHCYKGGTWAHRRRINIKEQKRERLLENKNKLYLWTRGEPASLGANALPGLQSSHHTPNVPDGCRSSTLLTMNQN